MSTIDEHSKIQEVQHQHIRIRTVVREMLLLADAWQYEELRTFAKSGDEAMDWPDWITSNAPGESRVLRQVAEAVTDAAAEAAYWKGDISAVTPLRMNPVKEKLEWARNHISVVGFAITYKEGKHWCGEDRGTRFSDFCDDLDWNVQVEVSKLDSAISAWRSLEKAGRAVKEDQPAEQQAAEMPAAGLQVKRAYVFEGDPAKKDEVAICEVQHTIINRKKGEPIYMLAFEWTEKGGEEMDDAITISPDLAHNLDLLKRHLNFRASLDQDEAEIFEAIADLPIVPAEPVGKPGKRTGKPQRALQAIFDVPEGRPGRRPPEPPEPTQSTAIA